MPCPVTGGPVCNCDCNAQKKQEIHRRHLDLSKPGSAIDDQWMKANADHMQRMSKNLACHFTDQQFTAAHVACEAEGNRFFSFNE